MVKQEWMIIVAGEDLVDKMTVETKSKCEWTGYGYRSEQLCALQCERSTCGIFGCEIVKSNYGYSVRYDSGLQNFALLASSRCGDIDGSIESAISWANNWVAVDSARRYAWMRK